MTELGRDLVIIPGTGELVDLDKPSEVARALAAIRAEVSRLGEMRSYLEGLLAEESSRVGTKTLRYGDLEAVVSGGEKVVWDIEELDKLQDAGLPEERYEELVKAHVEYRVDARVAKQLSSANPEYGRIIEQARSVEPAAVRVQVKRT